MLMFQSMPSDIFGKDGWLAKLLIIFATIDSIVGSPNVTEPDINTDRVVMKHSIAYHFIKHVRNVENEILITRRINIAPLVMGIQQMANTKTQLQEFCNGVEEAILSIHRGQYAKTPLRNRRSAKRLSGHRKRYSRDTPGGHKYTVIIPDPTIRITRDICNSIASQVSEIEIRSRDRLTKILNLVDISITINATSARREKRAFAPLKLLTKSKGSLGLFLLKTGIRSIWSLFGFVERIRTNRRLNRLEKDVAQLQLQQDKTSNMVDQLALVVTNHSILIDQLHITTEELTNQINDLTKKVDNIDEKLKTLRSVFQVTAAMTLLQSVVDRTRDAMDHGFYNLEHIVDKALMSETSVHLLPAEQIRKVQMEVSIFSNTLLDPEYHRMRSVIVSDPENPEFLRAIISVAALSRRNYELVELIPVPLFKGGKTIQPSLSHRAVILNHEEGLFTPLDPRELSNCLKNEHCITSGPELRTNTIGCGMPQFFNWHQDKCEFEPILSSGIFLKRLGADGIIFSLREEANAQLFCSAIPGQTRTLTNSGVLHMPAGCKLVITSKNGAITKIRSPPDTQIIQTNDLDLVVTGPDQLLQADGNNYLGNTSTILAKAISEQLIGIEKQLQGTNQDVNYHWSVVLSLSIVLGLVCLVMTGTLFLLYRYSGRFRKKVKIVRSELQGVGDRVVAFEREMAAKAKTREKQLMSRPRNDIDSIIRDLDKIEHRARLNDYLEFGNPASVSGSTDALNDFKRGSFSKFLDTTRPIPRPRGLYPTVPPRSDIYDPDEKYVRQQRDYEKLSSGQESPAPMQKSHPEKHDYRQDLNH